MRTENRSRPIKIHLRLSSEELTLIEEKMKVFGTNNREAYLRKMALDGYVLQLQVPELKEIITLMRRSSNNLNQLTKRVHETGRIYDEELEEIQTNQEKLWNMLNSVLIQIGKVS